jgi:hypothetical protein
VAAAAVPAALRVPGEAGRPGDGVRPRPPKAIPKGLFTEMFLAHLAYEKYVLGRPLHRIIAALAAGGLDVAEGSLAGALAQIAPLLAPWARAIEAHVAASGYVRAGEASWRVFAGTPGKDGNRWWLWVFGTDEESVFVMDPARSADVPAAVPGIDREQAALQAGRRSELAHLAITDIDHERQALLVRQGKGKKDRLIPVGERALAWVRRYLAEVRPRLATAGDDDGTLFLSAEGTGFSLDRLTQLAARYVKASGVPKTGGECQKVCAGGW